MKYLIVAVILGVLFYLIYLRLRPYINIARRVLGVVREARGMNAGQTIPNTVRQQRQSKYSYRTRPRTD